jgi:hypothetical protein
MQTKKEVSVHQGSLIRKACLYVRRSCMWVVCCSNCTWVRKKTNWLFTGNQNRILNPKTTNNLGTRGLRFNWEGGREGGREGERKNSVQQWKAESSFAGQWLPAAGGDWAWAVRTGSWLMPMCCDIFAAARLWRGRLLTTGHLSSRHPVVVGAGDVSWGSLRRVRRKRGRAPGPPSCVRVFISVSHL